MTEDVRGAWRLESFVFTDGEDANGDYAHRPLGVAPRGSVVVSPDGYLSLVFTSGDRAPFATDDVLGGTDTEKAAAAGTYISFGGPCRIEDDVIVVDVAHSSFPNWVGGEQRRRFALDGDTLTLQTTRAIPIDGCRRWGRATLRRIRSA